MMLKPVRLAINDSGSWRVICRFDAADDERANAILDAADTGTAAACPRCGSEMQPGIAIAQTYIGYGSGDVVTWSPGGPGLLVTCLKCVACGHSVTAADTAALCAPLAQA